MKGLIFILLCAAVTYALPIRSNRRGEQKLRLMQVMRRKMQIQLNDKPQGNNETLDWSVSLLIVTSVFLWKPLTMGHEV